MATNFRILNHNLAIFNARNIGGSATNLKEQSVGKLLVHQSTSYTSCGTRENSKDWTMTNLINGHYTTITTHNHKWRLNTSLTNTLVSHVCSFKHLWHDGCINNCCTGTNSQTIKLRDVICGCSRKFSIRAFCNNGILVSWIVYAKCFSCNIRS